MSAPVVYEGVESRAPEGRSGLFEGMKFWVALRVPQRSVYLSRIQQNGGRIVPLEKNADLLIADHMRKDAPNGSYSFKLIDDAIKSGSLGDIEEHLIRPQASAVRAGPSAGPSTAPSRGTRTPFTPEDDAFLIKWVLSNGRSDDAMGNKLYQGLQEANDRHTFHSWRDRWIKQFSKMSDKDLWLRSRTGDSPNSPPNSSRPDNGAPIRNPSAGRRTMQRSTYTDEDNHLLIAAIRNANRRGIQAGPKWFKDFAQEHPEHTATSWRDHWLKVLRSRLESEEAAGGDVGSRVKEPSLSPRPTQEPRREFNAINGSKSREASASRPPQRREEDTEVNASTSKNTNGEDEAGEDVQRRNEFFDNFRTFLQGFERPIDDSSLQPTVLGRSVDPFRLYCLIKDSNTDPEELDWKKVASRLGFNNSRTPSASAQLRKYWLVHLQEFASSLQNFEDEVDDNVDEDDDEEEGKEEEQEGKREASANDESEGTWTRDQGGDAPEHDIQQSPPPPPPHSAQEQPQRKSPFSESSSLQSQSPKRKHFIAYFSDQAAQESVQSKRQRRSRDDEIPSTPAAKLRVNVSRAGSNGLSPSLATEDVPTEKGTEDSSTFGAGGNATEPETQDFTYGTQAQEGETSQSRDDWDITPSQQLHNEEAVTSPIPFRLPSNSMKCRSKEEPRPRGVGSSTVPGTHDKVTRDGAPGSPRGAGAVARGKQREALTQEQDGVSQLSAEMERFEAMGYRSEDVRTAMIATTLDCGLAGQVMEILRQSKGIPKNMEGVWTERDDDGLRFVDGQPNNIGGGPRDTDAEWQKLIKKHTVARVEARRDFLGFAKEYHEP